MIAIICLLIPLAILVWMRKNSCYGLNSYLSWKISLERSQVLIVFLLLSISTLFVYFFSYSTSPYVPNCFGGDSAQFQTIGKAWAQGKIPYLDMFDHKGPFIFFVNMLGYSLLGTSIGVLVIQIIFLTISLWFIYLITQLDAKNYVYGFISVVLFLIILAYLYGGGNFTEEYCLPFICMCMYFQVKYLWRQHETSVERHNPYQAFLYGLSFGICIMSKVTNGLSIGAGILIITIFLILDRKWKNLGENAIAFIAGIGSVVLPFSLYFISKDVFSEFIYATIGYNMEYQKTMPSWFFSSNLNRGKLVFFLCLGFAYYTIFITSVLAWFSKRKCFALYCVLIGVLETYLYFSGALYTQYYIIAAPQIVLLINEVMLLDKNIQQNLFAKILIICVITIFCYSRFIDVLPRPLNTRNHYKGRSEVYTSLIKKFLKMKEVLL